ncbi:hypothetical protein [Flavobacterium hibernum]|uniref:Uncharacterized protein n=1 Tax=Flavobacterium hibernum TaxID=37752 RepID=A0A0D0EVM0_9FLAO|nr:hypothetical protein [Flavobacterium hibernum]KIO50966.1 hypothetical protein IW18_20505 [Flavobacterium hibernum]OXA85212.1 hypothetical protein B0A73_17845 [Flavobacterium hibernum]STO11336.1 Uncharacterised protein [Flavobacterium hibernum]
MSNFNTECEQVVDDFIMSFDKIKGSNLNRIQLSNEYTALINDVTGKLGNIAIKHSIQDGNFGVLYIATFAYSSRCQRYLEQNI